MRLWALTLVALAMVTTEAGAQGMAWKTSWAASVHGPYPVGNPSAQPDQRFAFPAPASGARNQTFRLIVRPSLWGRQARFRISNTFGTMPLTLAAAHLGLQLGGAALVPGTNRAATFGGKPGITIPAGESAWSDPVDLAFASDPDAPLLQGRKLAISLAVSGESGPMTWHAKAMQTSYVTAPGSGPKGDDEGDAPFPCATSSWFFLDALDVMAPASTPVIVAFGDSITDGTASVMNADDRWPDFLARRIAQSLGPNKVAIVNAGIGGNQIAGPAEYGPAKPFPGGPAATQRLPRDVIALSGVTSLVWLEGINDFSRNGNASTETAEAGMREGIRLLRAGIPGIRIIGATVATALGSSSAAHGFPEQDEKRKALNGFIRQSGQFDAVIDFDAVTLDPATGGLKPEFIPESTSGGAGDKLHPNRTGYHAMGLSFDPAVIVPSLKR